MNTKRVTRTIHKLRPLDVMRLEAGKHGDGGGLWLMKDSKTTGRYAYRYQLDGKAHELGIGSMNTFSLAEARDRAKAFRRLLKDGGDPLAERRAAKARKKIEAAAAVTFEDFAREYIESHRAGWSNAKHEKQWQQSLEAYAFPIIGGMSIGAVDTEAVKRVLLQPVDGKPFWDARRETASRVRSRIELILGAAKIGGKREGDNPAKWRGHLQHVFVARSKAEKGEKKHLPALPFNQVPSLVKALREREGTDARLLEFTILTCARTKESRELPWSEIKPDGTWLCPAPRMKSRKDHKVPLTSRALQILEIVKSDSKHVFPGRGGGFVSDKAMRRLMVAMGYAGYSIHGLRSSFRDWSSECTEHPRDAIEIALSHAVGTATERAYARSDLFNRRRALAADWEAFCGGATGTVLKFSLVG